jgi:hypothetical protein
VQNMDRRSNPFILASILTLLAASVFFVFGAAAVGAEVNTSFFHLRFAMPDKQQSANMSGLLNPFGEGFELSFSPANPDSSDN